MSQPQHIRDDTLVNNDQVHVASSKDVLHPGDATQTPSEINEPRLEPQSTFTPARLPPYIPYHAEKGKTQQARTLVLCFDGTGDQFDEDNSNIVQLVSMLKKDDKTKQMVYYQPGIGTYTSPAFFTPGISNLSEFFDTMFAWNIDEHVKEGYEFLMRNYLPGDKICLFGFSRGAYTARSLSGMIHKIGIIPADNTQHIPFAYKIYGRTDAAGWQQANLFKHTFSMEVNIEFIGVWDTVDSVGLIPRFLPETTSNTIVKTSRHAISLDECRAKFKPNFLHRPDKQEKGVVRADRLEDIKKLQELQVLDQNGDNDDRNEPIPTIRRRRSNGGTTLTGSTAEGDCVEDHLEMLFTSKKPTIMSVEEVWFAGCHCDIGGGSVENGTRYSLARIPLRWMIRECFKANTGILFDTASLYTIGIDPATLCSDAHKRPLLSDSLIAQARERIIRNPAPLTWPQWFKSWFTSVQYADVADFQNVPFVSEEDEDLQDALSPIYDQMTINRFWWIAEFIPLLQKFQRDDNRWVSSIHIFGNGGNPRFIPQQGAHGVKVHRSVKLRMESNQKNGEKYTPRAKLTVEPTWI